MLYSTCIVYHSFLLSPFDFSTLFSMLVRPVLLKMFLRFCQGFQLPYFYIIFTFWSFEMFLIVLYLLSMNMHLNFIFSFYSCSTVCRTKRRTLARTWCRFFILSSEWRDCPSFNCQSFWSYLWCAWRRPKVRLP